MSKIIAFAGSNSSSSINHELLQFIYKKYSIDGFQLVKLRDYETPMFSIDVENETGYPKSMIALEAEISKSSIVVIACSEHNGNMTSYLKATLDWLSRVNRDFLKDKKVFLVGTSPGRGAAKNAIQNVSNFVERLNGKVINTFALPSFGHAFEDGHLLAEHAAELDQFIDTLIKA